MPEIMPETEIIESVRPDRMYSIAQRIFNGETGHWFLLCLEEDKFYIYDGGVWRQIFDIEILAKVSAAFPNITRFPLSIRKQIIDNLKTLVYKPLSIFNNHGWLNFPEGLFDPIAEKLIDHHPDQFSTIRIPYSYNYNAKCPLWEKTLLEIFDNDATKALVLQEFFGYCLTKDTRKEKSLLLLGESRTGKSTILHILRHLIGANNVSSVPLRFINNPQYTPMLINKLVNIDADVSGKAQEFEAEFKIITSGEPVSCNQKFVATFDFMPYCKLVMAANEFPRITDHSSAFYKRLILIPCNRVFEESEQNISLKDDLIKELPGILNWAVDGLARLNERGRFEHNKFMTDAVAELREESNPVEAFFKEFVETDVSGEIELEKGELYSKYKQWAMGNGTFALSSIRFSQCVHRKYSKFTPKDSQDHASGRRLWKNLRLKLPPQQGRQVDFKD